MLKVWPFQNSIMRPWDGFKILSFASCCGWSFGISLPQHVHDNAIDKDYHMVKRISLHGSYQ
jgi:hypothetical protein